MTDGVPPGELAESVSLRWEQFCRRHPLVRFSVVACGRVVRARWPDPSLGGMPQFLDGKNLGVLVGALEAMEQQGCTFGRDQAAVRELAPAGAGVLTRLTARQVRHATGVLLVLADEASPN